MTLYSGKGMTGVKRMLALLMLLVMCSSCALSEAEPALTVNGNAVSRGEADAWMYLVRSAYAEICDYYQRCLGVSYWSLTYPNGLSVWMSVKSDAFEQLVMISLLSSLAKERGVELSPAEQSAISQSALSKLEQAPDAGFSLSDMEALLTRQLLAQKVYGLLASYQSIDEESVRADVSQGDCAACRAEYLCAPYSLYAQSDEARSGAAERLKRIAAFEGPYASAVALNPDLDSGYVTFTYAKLENDARLQSLAALKPGELSEVIETDFGLFIFRMSETDSAEVYESEVEEALWQARVQAFEAEYERMYEQCDYALSSEYWDSLKPW